ncbi:MAG: hypothetical protein CMJ64_28740 [Planctomycetaceae bacterium]|nr:hypothetical protein [Planctomycetaceae bacterium]
MCKLNRVHRRAMTVLIYICVLLFTADRQLSVANDQVSPPAGLRVFYTGHSFHMFVPKHVERIVDAAGIKGHKLVGTQGIGGSRVYQHWDLADGKNKAKPALATGEVDVFTMASHLTVPDRGITNFTELGLKHNPKLRLLVQVSWYPFDVESPEKRIRDNSQRNSMKIADLQAAVDLWRKKLEAQADDLNQKHNRWAVFLVPVGDAVVKLRAMVVDGMFPGVISQSALFRDPIGHVGPHVQALAAYCNYAVIYQASPEGLKPEFMGITDEQHAILQKLAWETVSRYPHSGIASRALSATMDDKFQTLAQRFVNESPSLSPVGATALGDHRFDDQLDEVSAAARNRERTFYNGLLGDLDQIDPNQLARANQVDYQ